MSEENFDLLYKDMIEFSENKDLFVQDLFGGADLEYRLPTRVYTEYAWHSLFIQNLLITVKEEEKNNFDPEFVIIDIPSFKANPETIGKHLVSIGFEKSSHNQNCGELTKQRIIFAHGLKKVGTKTT